MGKARDRPAVQRARSSKIGHLDKDLPGKHVPKVQPVSQTSAARFAISATDAFSHVYPLGIQSSDELAGAIIDQTEPRYVTPGKETEQPAANEPIRLATQKRGIVTEESAQELPGSVGGLRNRRRLKASTSFISVLKTEEENTSKVSV